jgi:hypothetical protein
MRGPWRFHMMVCCASLVGAQGGSHQPRAVGEPVLPGHASTGQRAERRSRESVRGDASGVCALDIPSATRRARRAIIGSERFERMRVLGGSVLSKSFDCVKAPLVPRRIPIAWKSRSRPTSPQFLGAPGRVLDSRLLPRAVIRPVPTRSTRVRIDRRARDENCEKVRPAHGRPETGREIRALRDSPRPLERRLPRTSAASCSTARVVSLLPEPSLSARRQPARRRTIVRRGRHFHATGDSCNACPRPSDWVFLHRVELPARRVLRDSNCS